MDVILIGEAEAIEKEMSKEDKELAKTRLTHRRDRKAALMFTFRTMFFRSHVIDGNIFSLPNTKDKRGPGVLETVLRCLSLRTQLCADFSAVFVHICNFDICQEIQLTNTNTKG